MPTEAVLFKPRRNPKVNQQSENWFGLGEVFVCLNEWKYAIRCKICIVSRKCMNVNRPSRQER
jgi:hypothetical protein